MEIQKRIDNNKGSFYIKKEGKQVAELDFEVKDNILDALHTGVRPELEGQGIASRLFDEMVKYARENGYKVKPTCPYIDVKFRRNPDGFSDVVYKS
jgi:predicted GNAT family acetyltransferase